MKQVEIYTDGACSGNPGPGGWGAVLRYRFNGKVYEKELSGGDASTTNNRMELTAFIEALRQLRQPVCHQRAGKRLGQGLEAPGLEKIRWLPCPEPGPLGAGTGAGSTAQTHIRLGQGPRRPPGKRALRPAGRGTEPGTWREAGTMSDTFLPGSGFDTYEQQDKVLVGLGGGTAAKVAVRILQQQGFAVAGAVVKLSAEEEPLVQSAKEAAKALGIECATLNAEALAAQGVPPVDARLSALLTAADKLGIQYIATGHFAQVETGADGISHIYPPEDPAQDESDALAALPQDILARLILPLGSFTPEDVQEMAADFNV